MFFRQSSKDFAACAGAPNREALHDIVAAGHEPGLLSYSDDTPVGWVAVSPREDFPRILRSPVVRPLDDVPGVWSIPCFYVARGHRRQGISRVLLDAAVTFAAEHGAAAVEGYPYEVAGDMRPAEAYTGTTTLFAAAGFSVVEPVRAPKRRTMRRQLQ